MITAVMKKMMIWSSSKMYNLLKDEETDDDLTTYEDIIDRLYDGYLEKKR